MWHRDGRGIRARIGLLTPHIDPVPESEFNALVPEGVSVHTARVPLGMVGPDGEITPKIGPDVARAFSEPPHVDNAVSSLAALDLSAIVYAFTSSSYILGPDADDRLKNRLTECAGGASVIVQTQALVAAVKALGAERIALFHPPWFSADLDRLGAEYFAAHGLKVLYHEPAKLRKDYGDIEPKQVFDWVRERVPDTADIAVIGGSGFRAVGAIEALESEISRRVVSANQAAFWYALRKSGLNDTLANYGKLFQCPA